MEARRDATKRKFEQLFAGFVEQGIAPDQAAARAINVIRFGKDADQTPKGILNVNFNPQESNEVQFLHVFLDKR